MEYVRRILVVGDEREFSAAVLRHLKLEGFLAESAHQREEARQKIQQAESRKAPFDLVIIHTTTQKTSGLDFLVWLQESHPGISAILISTFGHADESLELLRPAMDDYAGNPLTPQRIMDLIDSVDRRRRCSWIRLKKGARSVERRAGAPGG
jgi:two-component system response regulator PilR (NtrC family)